MILRAALVGWLIVGGVALAQTDSDEEAKAEFERGRTAFEEGRFSDAAKAFELAYQGSHKPELLWNIAQAHRRQFEVDGDLARLARAREVYRNYAELAATEKERADATREEQATAALIREVEQKRETDKLRDAAAHPVVVAPEPAPPIYRRWWFWTTIAVVVAAGAATAIALALTSDKTPPTAGGNWAPFGYTIGAWR
jgi:hypothetical protein